MEESNTQNAIRLTDWLILAFVVVVMGLLIFDVGSNVMDTLNRSQEPIPARTHSSTLNLAPVPSQTRTGSPWVSSSVRISNAARCCVRSRRVGWPGRSTSSSHSASLLLRHVLAPPGGLS